MADPKLQRMIHVGCKQLHMDNDSRRDLQLLVTGKASMTDMTGAELLKVLDALKQRGFNPTGNSYFAGHNGKGASKAPSQKASRADVRFIHVLWEKLGEAGALKSPGRAGLNAFIRSRFENKWAAVPIDVDALQNAGQINAVIRALKDMCKRARVDVT